MSIIAQRILAARKMRGMTQDELAEKSGYSSRTTIAKIEKGEVDLTTTKIILIANALDVSPRYLMGWEESDNAEMTKAVKEFLSVYVQLSPKNQDKIAGYAEGLLQEQSKT